MQEPTLAELHARLDQCKENLTNPEIAQDPELLEKLNKRIAGYEKKIADLTAPKEAPLPSAAQLKENPDVADILQSKANKYEKHYRLHLLNLAPEQIASLTGSPKNAVGRDIWYYTSGKRTLQ